MIYENKVENSLSSKGNDHQAQSRPSATILHIQSKASLIHIGSLDSFDITQGGKDAAGNILNYLDSGEQDSLKRAVDIYDRIIPDENFGGEYTALQWICNLLLAPEEQRRSFLSHSAVDSWFELLAKDDFANLREYIMRKYHFIENKKDDPEAKTRLRFLEDFILFNNPDRERWDKIAENIYRLGIKEGYHVIDFGCGPGYFTFKFADIVGEKGHVYGIETNERHISYVKDYLNKYNIDNIDIFEYKPEGLGLQGSVKADIIFMCSLYHILYAAFTDGERDLFVQNIKNYLKEDGRLIIVDNDLVESKDLPYHGPYISRNLIISQLWHYGFQLTDQYQFTVQRYILEFQLKAPTNKLQALPNSIAEIPERLGHSTIAQNIMSSSGNIPAMFAKEGSFDEILVTSPSSLVRYRMIGTSSQGYTLLGKKAARLFYAALEKKDDSDIRAALEAYEDLIPKERIGDEYTVFKWFCQYLLAAKEEQARMISDRFDAEYFHYLADDDFSLLKKYIRIKYDLSRPDPKMPREDDEFSLQRIHDVIYEYSGNEVSFDQLNEWNEFISFNNPNRESWERTGEMLKYINIKEGDTVADVGCGFGFFSFKFSDLVGGRGRVYSTEINEDALAYVQKISQKYSLNINTIKAQLNDACLPKESADIIFMCSMYHAVYIASLESVKDDFIGSLKRALKNGGKLVVVDNAITPPSEVAYFGSGIAKELAISQLKHYGFILEDIKQFIPQRYVLIFRQERSKATEQLP